MLYNLYEINKLDKTLYTNEKLIIINLREQEVFTHIFKVDNCIF